MHESIPLSQETAPTPMQLSKLASAAMATARSLDKMRPIRIKERANSFINEIDFINTENDEISTESHRMAFRVARQVKEVRSNNGLSKYKMPVPEWNMQIFDTRWFDSDSASAIGARSVYYFAWNQKQANRAEKHTRYVPYSLTDDSLEGALRQMQNNPIDISVLNVEDEYRRVSRNDLDYLADELNEYFESIKVH